MKLKIKNLLMVKSFQSSPLRGRFRWVKIRARNPQKTPFIFPPLSPTMGDFKDNEKNEPK